MALAKEKIFREITRTNPVDRAQLLEFIIESFNENDSSEFDKLWEKEINDRIEAYDKGHISARPIDEVFESIK